METAHLSAENVQIFFFPGIVVFGVWDIFFLQKKFFFVHVEGILVPSSRLLECVSIEAAPAEKSL